MRGFTSLMLIAYLGGMLVQASHFRGGVIMWRPGTLTGNPLEVLFTFRVGWRRSFNANTRCSNVNDTLSQGRSDLVCITGCPSRMIISPFDVLCTDFSEDDDWATGEKSLTYIMPSVGPFIVAFQDSAWITLVTGGGDWSLSTSLDLSTRSDTGTINSSPRTSLNPLVRLQHGCSHTIKIPVTDADGDVVRCRWATTYTECGHVCGGFPNAQLDSASCEITYEANYDVGHYAVAIMLEDYSPSNLTLPLSSVGLQFLVQVFTSEELCGSRPEFVPDTPTQGDCIGVNVNEVWRDSLIAYGGGSEIGIAEINTVSPPQMTRSTLEQLSANTSRVNVTWRPTEASIGENIFCYTATNDIGLLSDQTCIGLVAGVASPSVTEISPQDEIVPDTSQWTITFDKPIKRLTLRSAHLTFHDADDDSGRAVYTVDVTGPSAQFPSNSPNTIQISTTFIFQERHDYYVSFDRGVAVDAADITGQCSPISSPIRDPAFWRFHVRDVTPPVVSFVSVPSSSRSNLTLEWTINEETNNTCFLLNPSGGSAQLSCDLSWTGTNLEEGLHHLTVSAADSYGNIGIRTATWFVDKTAPSVTFTDIDPSSGPLYINSIAYVFLFDCSESGCTYEYEMSQDGVEVESGPLLGPLFTLFGVANSTYAVTLIATDAVGNRGQPVTITIIIDIDIPAITGLSPFVSVQCGDNLFPNNTNLGTPVVVDNNDVISVQYRDSAEANCAFTRTWTAIDEAGNEGTFAQSVTVANPQPPQIFFSPTSIVPCNEANDLIEAEARIGTTITVVHPCDRSYEITFQDSQDPNKCDITFERVWTVTDDCGQQTEVTQIIRVLPLLNPINPDIGEQNVDLQETLMWPQYASATSYQVYIWVFGEDRPPMPNATRSVTYYTPTQRLPENEQILWQIEFVVPGENQTTPSPIWGFVTRPLPDISVTTIIVPDFTYSGTMFSVEYTVENKGSANTAYQGSNGISVKQWYDAFYIDTSPTFETPKFAGRELQRRSLDSNDGYTDEFSIDLEDNEIGLYYVMIVTDYIHRLEEADTMNNRKISITGIDVRLTPPPNLVVDRVVLPRTTFSGKIINVRITVKNIGTGVTKADTWYDSVIIHDSPVLGDNEGTELDVIEHTGVLSPGAEYAYTARVRTSNRLSGDYYIHVKTDVYSNVYEHSSEEDNTEVSDAIEVTLSPPADLAVISVTTPATWTTGDTVHINVTVRNDGAGPTFEPSWTDRVIMEGAGESNLLFVRNVYRKLYDTEEYQHHLQLTVPSTWKSGAYMIRTHVNAFRSVFELENTLANNEVSTAITVTQSLPDLVIQSMTYEIQQNSSAAYLNARAVIVNSGTGSTHESGWIDRILLENENAQYTLTTERKMTPVSPGDTYEVSWNGPIPIAWFGPLTLKAQIDISQIVVETDDNNNERSENIEAPSVLPDLVIEQLSINSQSVQGGDTIEVSWTIFNRGNREARNMRWMDFVYIRNSNDQFKIGEESRAELLTPGDSYSATLNIVIPLTIAGQFDLLVVSNLERQVLESDYSNNDRGVQISIASPPSPDMIVREVTAQFNTETRIISVSWIVENIGNSMASESTWQDIVYLSQSLNGRLALELQTIDVTATLVTGFTYRRSVSAVVPSTLAGQYAVHVATDAGNDVQEINGESNNVGFSPVFISVPNAELITVQMQINSISEQLVQGQQAQVEYSVTIEDDVIASSWTDAIYISASQGLRINEVVNQAFRVSAFTLTTGALVDDTYTVSQFFPVPFGSFGNLVYIYIVADTTKRAGFITQGSDQGAFVASATPIAIIQGPLPDLAWDMNLESYNITGGQPFELQLNFTNIGESNLAISFFSALYLSTNNVLDPFDAKLATAEYTQTVEVNDTAVLTIDGTTPFDQPSGQYFFIVLLDTVNHVYELDEDNNMLVLPVQMRETVSTDLVTDDIAISADQWTYDEDVSVEWSLRNNGSQNAEGYKCDTVYMSPDKQWDIMDRQVGDTVCGLISLPSYSESQQTLDVSLAARIPLLVPDNYHALVRTRTNIKDPNLSNNVAVTNSSQLIDLPALLLGLPLTGISLAVGQSKAYVIPDVPADETLLLVLDSPDEASLTDLYVRYDEPATAFQFDGFSLLTEFAKQEVIIENTYGGSYFVLVTNNGQVPSTVNLLATIAELAIRRVVPPEISNSGRATLFVEGTLLERGMTARLYTQFQEATTLNVYYFSSTRLYAEFDMRSVFPGVAMSLELRTHSGDVTTLENAVRLIYGRRGSITFSMDSVRTLAVGSVVPLQFNYINTGDADLQTPLINIATTGPGALQMIAEGALSDQSGGVVLALPQQGPAGILPPTSYGVLHFQLAQNEVPELGRMEISVQQLPNDDSPNIYLDMRDNFKPLTTPDDVWYIVWCNFLNAVGDTMRSLQTRLSSVVTTMSLASHRSAVADKVVRYLLNVANGYLTGDKIISIQDTSTGTSQFVLDLAITREYSSVISKRQTKGPFGYGWIFPLIELEIVAVHDDDVVMYDRREERRIERSHSETADSKIYLTTDGKKYHYLRDGILYTFNATSLQLNSMRYREETVYFDRDADLGHVTTLRHSAGSSIQFSYNQEGFINQAVLMHESSRTFVFYDYSDSQLISVTANAETASYVYTQHDLTAVRYSSGDLVEYEYNNQRLLSRIEGILANGQVTSRWTYTYSDDGQVSVQQWPEMSETHYTFDVNTNVIAIEGEGVGRYTIERSSAGVVTRANDQLVIHRSYDEASDTYYTINGEGAVSSLTLDDSGRVSSYSDARNNKMTATYNDEGQPEQITYPDGSTEAFSYSTYGYLKTHRTRSGQEISYQFSADGLLESKERDDSLTIYSYDSEGRLTEATNADSSVEMSYDNDGLPRQVTYDSSFTLAYGYNDKSKRTSLSSGDGSYDVEYEYDERLRLSRVVLQQPVQTTIATFEYTNTDLLSRRVYGNGAVTSYTYFPNNNRLKSIVNTLPNGTISSSFNYTYDRLGRPVSIMTEEGEWKMRYDKASQLILWESPDSTIQVSYDKNGNRIKMEKNGADFGYAVNELNQYTKVNKKTLSHDRNGNLVKEFDEDTGETREFFYDSENKLTGVKHSGDSCTYKYDAIESLHSQTCSHTGNITYYMDPYGTYGQDVILKESSSGERTFFVHSAEYGLHARVTDGDVMYFLFDGVGSVVSILDDMGAIQAAYSYDPFGEITIQQERVSNEFKYVGQWGVLSQPLGSESGFYWMRSRMYSADYGRFLSPDRLGIAGKSTNLYTYSLNSPVLYQDPSGELVPAVIGAGAVIGALTNTVIYVATTISNPSESISIGGLVGSFVSGGITGAGVTVGATVGGGLGILATTGIGIFGGAAGYLTTQTLDGERIDGIELGYKSVLNGVLANFPRQMLRFSGTGAAGYGRQAIIKFRNIIFGRNKTGISTWLSLTLGNIIGSAEGILDALKELIQKFWPAIQDAYQSFIDWVQSIDPNDMIGPEGYGDAHFISIEQTLPYTIRFENDENATAPAQRVHISHQLDDDLDWRTFKLGSFGFGNFTQDLDYTRAVFQDRLDFSEGRGYFLDVQFGVDIINGKATWLIQTIDALTGDAPLDASVGFLPPNNGTTGQGFVSFQVKAKRDANTGTVIDAVASIVFDTNEPIATPPIFNTIDNDLPHVNISINNQFDTGSIIELTKFDNSSGVRHVDIYNYTNDGPIYQVIYSDVVDNFIAVPPGLDGQVQLVASAVDNVGNRRDLRDEPIYDVTVVASTGAFCGDNECSGRGNCSEFGFCICEPGAYGSDCSEEDPPLEPPILEISTSAGVEDEPVTVSMSLRPSMEVSGDAVLSIQLTDIPEGVTINSSSPVDDTFTIPQSDFGTFVLTPPEDMSGNLAIDLTGTITNNGTNSSRISVLNIFLEAVADMPLLSIDRSCYAEEQIRVMFTSSLMDVDGSEYLQLTVKDLPDTAMLNVEEASYQASNNTYILTNHSLSQGYFDIHMTEYIAFDVSLVASAYELSNGVNASRELSEPVVMCDTTCSLPRISNGGIQCDGEGEPVYQQECSVLCETPYRPNTTRTTCTTSGQMEPVPACILITCPIPVITNGNITCDDDGEAAYREQCDVTCEEGFVSNAQVTSCQDTGEFQPHPACDAVTCDVISIDNGMISCESNGSAAYEEQCNVICDEGYESSEEKTTCAGDGNLSPMPACNAITCDMPVISNGEVSCQDVSAAYEEECNVSCDAAFEPSEQTITCIRTGRFNPEPSCLAITCQVPDLDNGDITCQNNSYAVFGEECQVACETGFDESTQAITCGGSAELEPTPTCDAVTCEVISIDNGMIRCQNNESAAYAEQCVILCDDGFKSDDEITTCTDDGNLSPVPTCQAITCDIPIVSNGNVDCQQANADFGQECDVSCDRGYDPNVQTSTCSGTGIFNPEPACIEITCEVPNVSNGEITCQNNSHAVFEEECQVICETGFVSSTQTTDCGDSGELEPRATCDAITCEVISINNGMINCQDENAAYAEKCNVTCDEGYQGSDEITTCTEDGNLSPVPACLAITCDIPSISNGNILCQNVNAAYQEECDISCERGFDPNAQTSICVGTGLFSPEPSCIAITCTTPHIGNGSVICPSGDEAGFEETCSVSCAEGYARSVDMVSCGTTGLLEPSPMCIEIPDDCSCENGATTRIVNGDCTCECTSDWQGTRCQVSRQQLSKSVELTIRALLSHWSAIWTRLRTALATVINRACRLDINSCCPGALVTTGAGSRNFLGEAQIISSTQPEEVIIAGVAHVRVALYATSLPDNDLCTFAYGTARRKRQAFDGGLVDSGLSLEESILNAIEQSVLEQMIMDALDEIDNDLQECCNATLVSASAVELSITTLSPQDFTTVGVPPADQSTAVTGQDDITMTEPRDTTTKEDETEKDDKGDGFGVPAIVGIVVAVCVVAVVVVFLCVYISRRDSGKGSKATSDVTDPYAGSFQRPVIIYGNGSVTSGQPQFLWT